MINKQFVTRVRVRGDPTPGPGGPLGPAHANTRDELFINHYHLLIIHYLSFINHLCFNHLVIIYLSFN